MHEISDFGRRPLRRTSDKLPVMSDPAMKWFVRIVLFLSWTFIVFEFGTNF